MGFLVRSMDLPQKISVFCMILSLRFVYHQGEVWMCERLPQLIALLEGPRQPNLLSVFCEKK
jgi:hypothetical protein